MGHYASEMDPEGSRKRYQHAERVRALRENLAGMSLIHFTVGDLPALMNLMKMGTVSSEVSEEDLQKLEDKIE